MSDEDTDSDDSDTDDSDEERALDHAWLVPSIGGRLWFGDGDAGARHHDYVSFESRDAALVTIEDALTRDPPRSLVVVGEAGVGKSTLIREATRRLHDQGAIVFEATSTDVTAGQSYVGQLEGRVQQLARASAGRPLVWVMPDLHAAVGAGSYRSNPQGLLDMLVPYLARGELQLIAEATATSYAKIRQLRPGAVAQLDEVRLEPLGDEDTLTVAAGWAQRRRMPCGEGTLREALELAQEHLPGAAGPGNLLRLLRATYDRMTREDVAPGEVTAEHLMRTVADISGLPLVMVDPARRLDLDEVRRSFTGKVLGQPEAVGLLVERIAMIKAGLTDPTRPLGVFFFVGPTGTGKTELAKALAEYLFGSASRLVRLDMSEFQTADSVERLLAGPESFEGAPLVPAIRRQPFSVVLLDEFEKAHPRVWDVFLQLFDDGRLTDRAGSVVDFRQTVVIMTSNLGSGSGRGGLGFATTETIEGSRAIDRAVADAFRPEFVNRIDRIVAFRHLTRDVMRVLVRKELRDVTRRRGLRTRPWSVEWDESAVEYLLQEGFTPDLGARPLKRAVETHVLVPLARAIVEHQVPEGDQFLLVSARGSGVRVEFIDPAGQPPAQEPPQAPAERTVRTVALDPQGSLDEAAFLREVLDAAAARAGRWAVRKRDALEEMAEPAFWERPDRFAVLGMAEQLDRLEAVLAGARSLLGRLQQATRRRDRGPARLAGLLAQRLHVVEAALDALEAGEPGDAFVAVRADPSDPGAVAFAARLGDMYRRWARSRGMQLEELGDGGSPGLLAVSGFGAWRIVRGETGLHLFELPAGGSGRTFNRVNAEVVVAAQPDEPRERDRGARRSQAERAIQAVSPEPSVIRRYREEPSPLVRDATGWRTGRLDRVLDGDFDLF